MLEITQTTIFDILYIPFYTFYALFIPCGENSKISSAIFLQQLWYNKNIKIDNNFIHLLLFFLKFFQPEIRDIKSWCELKAKHYLQKQFF